MPSIELLTPSSSAPSSTLTSTTNPLPQLLQTPSGLAILEIQGTIHGPFQKGIPTSPASGLEDTFAAQQIGRLEFPLYNPSGTNDDGKWMKKVYLYVGKYQRLTGEVKKLGKPLGVIRKADRGNDKVGGEGAVKEESEALEIVDIVRFKVLFSGRPEPVGE